MKTDLRVFFAVFYSSIPTVSLHPSGKLLGAKQFTMSTICSSAYIPSYSPPLVLNILLDAHCPK
jgi:hypothetical protein